MNHDAVISGIYAATAGRGDLRQPLEEISQAYGLWGMQVIGVDKRRGSLLFSVASSADRPEIELDYVRFYHAINPRVAPTLTMRPDAWFHCHEHFGERFVARSEFYQEFLIPYGGRYLSGTKLLENDEVVFLMGAMRPVGADPLGPAEMPFFNALKHHLSEALQNYTHLRESFAELEMGKALLEQFTYPMVLVDESRGIWHRNAPAASLLRKDDWLGDRGGYLAVHDRAGDAALTTAVQRLLNPSHADPVLARKARRTIRIERRDGSALLLFLSVVWPESSFNLFGSRARVLVIAHDPARPLADLDPLLIAECFALTPAEARVAIALARGRSPKEIAREHGTSLATVRTQVQHVYEKVGVDRQSLLVATLLAIPGR